MSDNTQATEKPQDRILINVNGEDKEVFMSGGLIRQLMPIAGQLEDFALVFTDVQAQNQLIVEALRPRTQHGTPKSKDKEIQQYTIDDFTLSVEDTDKFVSWIMEHVLHFFVNSLTSAKKLVDKNEQTFKLIQKLTQSQTGLQDSQETNPSAGPSTAAPAM